MRKHVIPTVFETNPRDFLKTFKKLVPLSKDIQIDFMDGKFVKKKGLPLSFIPKLSKYANYFEAHLMVETPEKYVLELKKKGFKKILFHYESYNDVEDVKKLCKYIIKLDLIPGVVFNTKTLFKKVKEIKDHTPIVVFMGHKPGVEGIGLKQSVLKNIKKLRALDKEVVIQVDGGVNDKTIDKLVSAGVDLVNVGSFVSDSENPHDSLWEIRRAFRN